MSESGGDRKVAARSLYRIAWFGSAESTGMNRHLDVYAAVSASGYGLLLDIAADTLRTCEWVVYARRPFAGPTAMLEYLLRYTHRVAISNQRLVAFDERGVTFRWKDYCAKGCTRYKTMTLEAGEFMRRFLLLPCALTWRERCTSPVLAERISLRPQLAVRANGTPYPPVPGVTFQSTGD